MNYAGEDCPTTGNRFQLSDRRGADGCVASDWAIPSAHVKNIRMERRPASTKHPRTAMMILIQIDVIDCMIPPMVVCRNSSGDAAPADNLWRRVKILPNISPAPGEKSDESWSD
jgi:hypothetical protein